MVFSFSVRLSRWVQSGIVYPIAAIGRIMVERPILGNI